MHPPDFLYAIININMVEELEKNPVLKLGPTSTGQVLYFFGARHTNNPADKQFSQLRQSWEAFLDVAKGIKIILVEGTIREISQDNEEAIREYGETGAIQWLAKKANVNVIRPEPSDEEQRKLLCVSFNPQLVAYALITQNLAGWFRHTSQTGFDEAVDRVLNREVRFSNIYGFKPDKFWFNDQHKKLFGDQQLENKNFLDSISDPRKKETIINSVVAFRSKLRDEHILLVIAEAWKSGNSIFIVYGNGHLSTMENKLRELFNVTY